MEKLEMMKVFVKVCEVESFTLASESLNLPKATVSLAVSQLEEVLKTRLLHRTTRKVTITHDGETFLERAKDLIADFEDAESMFEKGHVEISGRIRVDMPTNLASRLVIKKLPEFLKAHPQIHVELGSTDRKVDLIKEGFDFVIRVGSLAESGLIAKKIGEYTIINCASPAYLKEYGTPKKLEDLTDHYIVHFAQTFGSRPDHFEYFDGEKYSTIKMKSMVTVNNVDAYRNAAMYGLGITQVPYYGVAEMLKSKELVEILPKLKAESMPISIVYPNRRNIPKRVRVFMDWVEKVLKESLY